MKLNELFGRRILMERIGNERMSIKDKSTLISINVESETESGIVIPELAGSLKPLKGRVFLVGDECDQTKICVGDLVLYDKAEYQVMNSEGKDYDLIDRANLISRYENV